MDLSFIFYLFAAFIVIPGTFFVFSSMKKYFAALIATIGMLTFFVLFGIQMFSSDGTMKQTTVSSKFPPSINVCPDMFTLLDNAGTPVCVDTVCLGTSINRYIPVTAASSAQTPTVITVGTNALSLHTDITVDRDRKLAIVNDLKAKSITWEGIWDGFQEYNNTIPRPT